MVPIATTPVRSSFTVDVEDGVSLAMRDVFGRHTPQTDRVVRTTDEILDLLAAHDTRGTFFVLGQVGERFPELVKRIAAAGHEVGVHGYNHLLFHRMTPALATKELSSARKLLQDLSGQPVSGHRAPAFSISPATPWAWEVLIDCGFGYDSSIMPIQSGRYGWPDFPEAPVRLTTPYGGQLLEVPITPLQLFSRRLPYSGGSYLRLLPWPVLRWAFHRNSRREPGNVLYIHPYELDTETYPDYYLDALAREPLRTRLRMRSMWVNRGTTHRKLAALLTAFPFTTMQEWIDDRTTTAPLPVLSCQTLSTP